MAMWIRAQSNFPTSAVQDSLFMEMVDALEKCCGEDFEWKCANCMVRERCKKWWSGLSERSTRHPLSEGEHQKAKAMFEDIRRGL